MWAWLKGGDNLLRQPPLHLPHVPLSVLLLLLLLLPLRLIRIKSKCRTWRRRCRRVGATDNVAAATTDNRGWSSAFLQLPQLCLLPLATSRLPTCPLATVAGCRQLALHLIKLQPSAASRMCRSGAVCAACGSSSLESRRTIIELCGKWQQKELRCQSENIIKSSSAIDMQRAANKERQRERERREKRDRDGDWDRDDPQLNGSNNYKTTSLTNIFKARWEQCEALKNHK